VGHTPFNSTSGIRLLEPWMPRCRMQKLLFNDILRTGVAGILLLMHVGH
jgi:hypothetical protein